MKTLPIIFHSQPQTDHAFGEKRTVVQNIVTFHERIVFVFKCPTYVIYIYIIDIYIYIIYILYIYIYLLYIYI